MNLAGGLDLGTREMSNHKENTCEQINMKTHHFSFKTCGQLIFFFFSEKCDLDI